MDAESPFQAARAILRGEKSFRLDTTSQDSIAPLGVATNPDIEPIQPGDRTWTGSDLFAYWCSDLLNVSTWSGVAAFVATGMAWWEAILAWYLGGVITVLFITTNGLVGARTHLPFAVLARSVFGYYGCWFAIVSRIIICWFWGSINTYGAGYGVTSCITAIWPSYATLPNTLSAASGLTSQGLLSFVIFWLIQLPFTFVHPKNLRWYMRAKAVLVPIVALVTMAVTMRQAHSIGQLRTALVTGSTLKGWSGFFRFMTATTAATQWFTMAVNIQDFTRFCKSDGPAYWQVLYMPLVYTGPAMFGAITAQCTGVVYGEVYFMVFFVYDRWNGSSGARFGAFLCSAIMALSVVGTNITGVTLPSATDLATLFPRYINIFRGSLVAITVGVFAFVPWKVLASASSLLSFMASYIVLLAPFATLLTVDYFLVKKGKFDVPGLYDPHGRYRMNVFGCNWRAFLTLLLVCTPVLPGMAQSIKPSINIGGLKWLYCIATIWCCAASAVVFWALNVVFPQRSTLMEENLSAADYFASTRSQTPEKEKDASVTTSVAMV